MKVRRLMTAYPLTTTPESSVRDAAEMMMRARIRALPVVEAGVFVGILTDRDLRIGLGIDVHDADTEQLSDMPRDEMVADWMTIGALTLDPTDTLSEACRVFVDHKVGSLPVVDADGVTVGILSASDVLRAAIVLFEDLDDDEDL